MRCCQHRRAPRRRAWLGRVATWLASLLDDGFGHGTRGGGRRANRLQHGSKDLGRRLGNIDAAAFIGQPHIHRAS
jgi:hypothetical protein